MTRLAMDLTIILRQILKYVLNRAKIICLKDVSNIIIIKAVWRDTVSLPQL